MTDQQGSGTTPSSVSPQGQTVPSQGRPSSSSTGDTGQPPYVQPNPAVEAPPLVYAKKSFEGGSTGGSEKR